MTTKPTKKLGRGSGRGPGRHSREEKGLPPIKHVTFRIEPHLLEQFRELCAARGLSGSKQFAKWIEQSHRKLQKRTKK